MPDAHDPHERSRAANGSDIATLLRAFDNYNATPQGREVHIPAGATQSGRAVPALAIWMDDNTLCVETIADDGTRSEAPEEERAWALDLIRSADPEMAERIESVALAALGDEDISVTEEVVAGMDDLADGLPTLEEALSLLDGISCEVSREEGDVVPLQGALRAIAENTPERLSQPPIMSALAKLRLDSKPHWNRIKGMLGRKLPPGLAQTVGDKCAKVARARKDRAERAAISSANSLRGDATRFGEPGPEIDSIVEALKDDPDAALTAKALDALLALQRHVDEARSLRRGDRTHLLEHAGAGEIHGPERMQRNLEAGAAKLAVFHVSETLREAGHAIRRVGPRHPPARPWAM